MNRRDVLKKLYICSYKIRTDDNSIDNNELEKRVNRTFEYAKRNKINIGDLNKNLPATEIHALSGQKLNISLDTTPEQLQRME